MAAINCEKKSQFNWFIWFLDDVSFGTFESLYFIEDHTTLGFIDIAKAFELISSTYSRNLNT